MEYSTALVRCDPAIVSVWDGVVRGCHWTLATAFAVAFLAEEGHFVHQAAGYVVLSVVAGRLVWGFVGPRPARFSDFVPGPRQMIGHVRELVAGRERRYLGHNPAAGAMAVALLSLMIFLGVTGWMLTTDQFFGVKWLEMLHEGGANVALGLVGLHIAGAVYASIRHRENLPWAMITGRKRS